MPATSTTKSARSKRASRPKHPPLGSKVSTYKGANDAAVVSVRVTQVVEPIDEVKRLKDWEASQVAGLALDEMISALRRVTQMASELEGEHAAGCRCRVCVCRGMLTEVRAVGAVCVMLADALESW